MSQTSASHSSRPIEATAIIRRNGTWTVYLGPCGLFQRWCMRKPEDPELERRLGTLAACCGVLINSALERAEIANDLVRVTAHRTESTSAQGRSGHIQIHALLECEHTMTHSLDWIDTQVRQEPLFSVLTDDVGGVDIRFETQARTHIRMP